MNLLFWITIAFIIIGFVILAFIRRNVKSKNITSTKAIVWFIVGTTVWGITSIFLVVRFFGQFSEF